MDSQRWPFGYDLPPTLTALPTIDLSQKMASEGIQYFYRDHFTLDLSGVRNYLITAPALTVCSINFGFVADFLYQCKFEIYQGATHTGTNAQTSYNRNLNITSTSNTLIHEGATGGSDGTCIYAYETGVLATKYSAGSAVSTTAAVILKGGTKYMARFTSFEDTNLCNLLLLWSEVSPTYGN